MSKRRDRGLIVETAIRLIQRDGTAVTSARIHRSLKSQGTVFTTSHIGIVLNHSGKFRKVGKTVTDNFSYKARSFMWDLI